ncbi:hypothetical protein [Zhongshania sp. BJYM1]|uniref:hypothetical protein n=1 Tax=Zhongshania aquatica TaxID=2965069 RepID=UPI0022B5943C|nr:hypothetical protein [Marortus sp. BJYM1]
MGGPKSDDLLLIDARNAERCNKLREEALMRGAGLKDFWLSQLGGAITTSLMAHKLGVDEDTLEAYRLSGNVLGLQFEGDYRYPIWQINDQRKVIAGLDKILLVMNDSVAFKADWSKLMFFVERNPLLLLELGDDLAIPAVALRDGHIDAVIKAVSVYMTHGCY